MYLIFFAMILLFNIPPETNALPIGFAVQSSLGKTLDERVFGEQQKLTASDGTTQSYFGAAVALDENTALVGAFGGILYEGAVYVFTRSGDVWTEQQKLTASDGEAGDEFGSKIAMVGDTALIGASGDDIGANSAQGSVYVFTRSGGVWAEQQKLTADDGVENDFFGNAVALDGDTALIGASSASAQGSAYVFERSGGVWTQQQKLTASDGAAGDRLGYSVALDADTALIGAAFDNVGANNSQGSAYVFVRSGGVWTQQQKLTASDGAAGDQSGYSVALDADTALIGAAFDAVEGNGAQGSVYVFERSGGVWTEQQKLTASDGAAEDTFSYSLALVGNTALIGVLDDDIGANNTQGSAYVFLRNGDNWFQYQKLIASDGAAQDRFGWSVALSGNTVLVGANGDNTNQGAAYAFTDPALLPTSTPLEPTATSTPTLTPSLTPEPDITELIANGDFENLGIDSKPDIAPWTVKNTSGDKAKCNKDKDGDGLPDKIVAFSGDCAFQFKNVIDEAGKLQQTLDLSGINFPTGGDTLDLSFYAQSKGGATVKAKVVLKYADDTKTKITVESSGTETYSEFTGSDVLTSADIEKAKIGVKSGQTAGKVYLDLVSLKHSAGNVEPTPTPPPPTETLEARLSGSAR